MTATTLQAELNRLKNLHHIRAPLIERGKLVPSLQTTIATLQNENKFLLSILSHRPQSKPPIQLQDAHAALSLSRADHDLTAAQLATSRAESLAVRELLADRDAALAELRTRCKDLEVRIVMAERSVKDESDISESMVHELQNRIATFQNLLRDTKEEVRIRSDELRAEKINSEDVARAFKAEVASLDTRLRGAVQEVKAKDDSHRENRKVSESMVTDLKCKLLSLEKQLQDAMKVVDLRDDKLQSENLVSQSALHDLRGKVSLLEKQLRVANSNADALRGEKTDADTRVADVSQRASKLEDELQSREKEHKQQIKELRTAAARKGADAVSMRKKVEDLVRSRESIAAKNGRLASSRAALKKECSALAKDVKRMQQEQKSANVQRVAHEKAVGTLQGIVKKVSKERDDALKKMEVLRKEGTMKKSDAEKNVVKLEGRVEKLKKELKKTVASAVQSDPTAVKELEGALKKSEKLAEAREMAREVWKTKFESVNQRLQGLKKEFDTTNKALLSEKSKAEMVLKEKEEVQNKLKSLEATRAANRLSTSLLQPTPTGALLSPAPLAFLPIASKKVTETTSESQSRFTDTLPFNVDEGSDFDDGADKEESQIEEAFRDERCTTEVRTGEYENVKKSSPGKSTRSILQRSSKRAWSSTQAYWKPDEKRDGENSVGSEAANYSEASGSTSVYHDKNSPKVKEPKAKKRKTRRNGQSLPLNRKALEAEIIKPDSNETVSEDVVERGVGGGRVLRSRKPVSYDYDKEGRDIIGIVPGFQVDQRALRRTR